MKKIRGNYSLPMSMNIVVVILRY